jgi:putative hydrolase
MLGGALMSEPQGIGGFDFNQLGEMLSRLGRAFSSGGDGSTLSPQTVRELAAIRNDAAVPQELLNQCIDALRVADLWLDPHLSFAGTQLPGQIWNRSQWINGSAPAWCAVVEPLSNSLGRAVGNALSAEVEPGMAGIFAQMNEMMKKIGSVMFATQLAEALKGAAETVTGAGDAGIPLIDPIRAILIPENVLKYADGLNIPFGEVLHYLAVREQASARLFAHTPWLPDAIIDSVNAYSLGIQVNIGKMQGDFEQLSGNPEAINDAIQNGLFAPEESESQRQALKRLELLIALIEGWIDEVSAQTADSQLPHSQALREMSRRRRATEGPLQRIFAALLGLEVSPRMARDAAHFFRVQGEIHGNEYREGLWESIGSLPLAEELSSPEGFKNGRSAPDDLSAL